MIDWLCFTQYRWMTSINIHYPTKTSLSMVGWASNHQLGFGRLPLVMSFDLVDLSNRTWLHMWDLQPSLWVMDLHENFMNMETKHVPQLIFSVLFITRCSSAATMRERTLCQSLVQERHGRKFLVLCLFMLILQLVLTQDYCGRTPKCRSRYWRYCSSHSYWSNYQMMFWFCNNVQMMTEVESWPYSFPASEDFLKSHQRGNVSGRLLIRDR